MKQTYKEYLQSDHWRTFRKQYFLERNSKGCEFCKANVPLDLHHRTYARVGREKSSDVIPLCRSCHDEVHDLQRNHGAKNLQVATDTVSLRHGVPTVKSLKKEKRKKSRRDKQQRRQERRAVTKKHREPPQPFDLKTLKHVDAEEIKQGMTERGGFKKKQLAKWGVPWPPPKGWRSALIFNP